MNTHLDHRHDSISAVVLAALSGLAVLGAGLAAVLDATGRPRLVVVGLVLAAALVAVGRWLARRVRERREDASDLLAGAAWRAQHMPHLATRIDNRVIDTDRAAVA